MGERVRDGELCFGYVVFEITSSQPLDWVKKGVGYTNIEFQAGKEVVDSFQCFAFSE